jgi:hypothetical protein
MHILDHQQHRSLLKRCRFWDNVSARLDAQNERLTPAARRRIEKAIAAKVPRPTKRARAQVSQQWG